MRKRAKYRMLVRNFGALLFGMLVGVGLVTSYAFIHATLLERAAAAEGSFLLAPADAQAQFALVLGSLFAVGIGLASVPVWLLLKRFGLARGYTAAALGFIMTMASWIIFNLPTESLAELVRESLKWSLCGAGAGLATWWARPREAQAP